MKTGGEHHTGDQEYWSCRRKRKYTSRKGAAKAARRAGALFERVFRLVRCKQFCGFFHVVSVAGGIYRGPPGEEERELSAPSAERERAAREATARVVRMLAEIEQRRVRKMAIEMVPVKSSNVRAVGVDGERLLVQFDNGVYECVYRGQTGVSTPESKAAWVRGTYERFLAAESKGRFYAEQIRRQAGAWAVRKLGEAEEPAQARQLTPVEQLLEKESKRFGEFSAGEDYRVAPAPTPQMQAATRKRVLILTVGLPCSGKSTWARATGFPVVSPDAIRLALHGRVYEQLAEPFVWAQARLMVRALFVAGHTTVVLDACNATRARRNEWRGGEWETACQVFDASREECLRRALKGGSFADVNDTATADLLTTIDRMAKNWEPLGDDEPRYDGAGLRLELPPLVVGGLDAANVMRSERALLDREMESKTGLPLDGLETKSKE